MKIVAEHLEYMRVNPWAKGPLIGADPYLGLGGLAPSTQSNEDTAELDIKSEPPTPRRIE